MRFRTPPYDDTDEWWDSASVWAKAKLDPEKGELHVRSWTKWDANPRWETSMWLSPDCLVLWPSVELTREHSPDWSYDKDRPGPIWTHRHAVNVTFLWWSFSLMREGFSRRDIVPDSPAALDGR
jgi:hypothetical protein